MGHSASALPSDVVDMRSGVEVLSAEEKLNALRRAVHVYASTPRATATTTTMMQTDTEEKEDESLEGIRTALKAITSLEDVGLSLDRVQRAIERSSGPYQQIGSKPVILYRGLHEDERFSLGVFCIPDGGVIPLHDHPGMTVVSKVIHGEMHVRSFDFHNDNDDDDNSNEEEEHIQKEQRSVSPSPFHANERAAANAMHTSGGKPAHRVNDSCVTAGDVLALFPRHGGNVHEFTGVAGPSSVFVDLAPDGAALSTPASKSPQKKKKTALLLRACNEPDWFACYDIDAVPI